MHLDGFGGLSQPEEENEKVTQRPDAEMRICFPYKEWPGIVGRVDAHSTSILLVSGQEQLTGLYHGTGENGLHPEFPAILAYLRGKPLKLYRAITTVVQALSDLARRRPSARRGRSVICSALAIGQ
jgi:hypothetical protein